jgi:hypothetical protein
VTNKLKLTKIARDGEGKGYSKNWFESGEFMHLTWTHYLPLKKGEFVPKPVVKTSSKSRFRLDKRKPISISHRYLRERLK